jgi:thiamine-phosphate pyrophosphorylase
MLVTDARRARTPLLDLVAEATAGGVDAIYLRDVALSAEGLTRFLRILRQRIGEDVALLLNGGPGAAREAGTGLHLRERDTTPAAARAVLGPGALIGRSVHSSQSAIAATGADYVLAGHVYPSASKPGLEPLSLAGLAAIVAAAPCPVLAIGGIAPGRVAEVIQTGASGVAVIGAIAESDDPRAAAKALRTALDHALQARETEPCMDEPSGASDTATMIDIIVNGKAASVPTAATVHDFLASKRMTDAMAIVERNGEIVPRGRYGDTPLQAGDRLEVVHAVGGG